MIGGANIESASKQTTTFEKAKPGEITKKTVTEKLMVRILIVNILLRLQIKLLEQ